MAQPDERRFGWPLALIATALCLAIVPAHGQDRADLFASVFGGRPAEPTVQDIALPIRFLLYELGPVPVKLVAPDNRVRIERAPFAEILKDILTDEAFAEFQMLKAGEDYLDIADLEAAGIACIFGPTTLSLSLTVPWEKQRQIDLSLLERRAPPTTGPIAPSDFSAILNLRGSFDVASAGVTGTENSETWGISVDPAFQFRGAVLESDIEIDSEAAPRTQVRRIRAFYDHMNLRMRSEIGDVNYATSGLQAAPPIAGIALSRDFGLAPERPFRPRGSRHLTIERNTVVKVYSGSRVIDTFALPPGRYRLTDLPLGIGGNDFRVELTDDQDQVRNIDFALFFDPGLLGEGESDFGLAAGFRTRQDGAYESVDREDIVASGFFRAGVTDWLTLGVGAQGGREGRNITTQMGVATPIGNFAALGDMSLLQDRFGGSTTAQWELLNQILVPGALDEAPGWSADFGLQATYTSRYYTPFGNDPSDVDQWIDVRARMAHQFGDDWQVTLTGNWQKFRTTPEQTRLSAALRYRITSRISLDLTADWSYSSTNSDGEVGLSLSFPFGENKSGTFNTSSADKSFETTLSRRETRPVGDWSASLTSGRNEFQEDAELSQRYTAQRFVMDTRVAHTRPRATPEDSVTSGRVSVGTAFVLAGGTAAVSRPVSRSFALVKRHPQFHDTDIIINPSNNAFLARTDGLGPLVLPDLSDYLVQGFRIEAPKLRLGMDLGNEVPLVHPRARSGVVVMAGTAASLIISGTLQNPDGTPISLKAGELAREGGSKVKSFFTNRQGAITVDGLRPGTYRLTMLGRAGDGVEIKLDPGAMGIVRLGTIEVP